MSVKTARSAYVASSSFDVAKAVVWLAAGCLPWAALYLIGRHIF